MAARDHTAFVRDDGVIWPLSTLLLHFRRDCSCWSLRGALYGLHKAGPDPNFVPLGTDRHLGAFRLTELQAQLKNLPRLFRLRMDRGREKTLIMPSAPIRIRPGEGGQLIVQLPYSPDHVTKIKTVPGRRWHAKEQHWTVPQGDGTLGKLLNLFPGKPVEVDPTLGAMKSRDKGKSSSSVLVPVLADLRTAVQARHYSRRTEQAYSHWVSRFLYFHKGRSPAEMAEAEINQFLTHLAVTEKVSASTQNQALAALLFLYRQVIGREMGDLGEVIRARKPERLPVVMAREEVKAVLANLTGDKWLIAALLYGAGLRLMECLRLRVQDIDFSRNEILVRDGKGAKDRITMLPELVKTPLQRHLTKVKAVHQQDVADGWGRVQLPHALDRKYPQRAKGLALAVGVSPRESLEQCADSGTRSPSC